ncbi:MAG: PASTA domain-containing protein [Acidimicrobiales bacterium]
MAIAAASLVLLTPASSGAAGHAPLHMPNLVGRSRLAVYRTMRHDGLYFVTRGPGSANDHWAVVTAQLPKPGATIDWHGQASLVVTNVAPHVARAVPRLIGLTKARVYAVMRHDALYFRTVGPGSTTGTWTVALSQSPRPGTRVPWHGEITIHVSTRRPVAKNPVTTAATPPVVAGSVIDGANFKVGIATWYDYVPGRCATWYLPKGTVITVRDLTTGRSITCVITDREAHTSDHVVDLSETQFSELEPLWRGVISVKVSW